MSILKTIYCDCCGKKIPFNENKIQSEYDGYVAYSDTYIAKNNGNPDRCYHSPSDKIYGLVDIQMYRSYREDVIVPNNNFLDGRRCKDICTDCKIKFLENTIQHLKKYNT